MNALLARLAEAPTETYDLLELIFAPGRPFFEPQNAAEQAALTEMQEAAA